MAELSPQAQAVLDTVCDNTEPDCDTQHLIAAALRAAADQVVPLRNAPKIPFDAKRPTVEWHVWDAKQRARADLLVIATELENQGCLAKRDDPSLNEATYGLPVMVQRIAENIFEALPADEAKAFFAAFPDAVGCDDKDLSAVGWQFLAAELRSLPEQPAEIQAVIDPVIAGMALLASGQEWPADLAESAHAAAWVAGAAGAAGAAIDTAWWASGAATDDAVGDSAAKAAVAARAASRAAGRAAADWPASSAKAVRTARLRQRDLLLRLISESPVVEQLDD